MSKPRRTIAALAVASVLAAALTSCGAKATTGKVDYSVTAEENYERGMTSLADEDWIAARKYFRFIKARFPYSKYAVLSELRSADAEFGAAAYLQAIDSYKMFAKFHPTHDMVVNGYCEFRIGESFFKMLPSDFWMLPPSYEKDQSSTSDAHLQLGRFVRKYPESPFTKRANDMLGKLDKKLAEHEWYVANFYWERDKPMGTVMRLRRLLSQHTGVGYDADALYLLGEAYIKTGMVDRARKTWQRLLKEHPKHKKAAEVRSKLGGMSQAAPAAVPQLQTAAARAR